MGTVDASLPDLFQAQAAETPEALAIVFGREQLSYSVLDRATDSLAAYLRTAASLLMTLSACSWKPARSTS